MRLIKNTTELIGIKDPNIIISLVFETDTHIEIQAKLDYPAPPCPHCQGKMIKYDFQRPSKIPLLEQAGIPTLLRLKKRRFQCKSCRRTRWLRHQSLRKTAKSLIWSDKRLHNS